MIQIVCDMCGAVLESAKDNSAFVFLEWRLMGTGKALQPEKREENYCSSCTDKIKDAVQSVKKSVASKAGSK